MELSKFITQLTLIFEDAESSTITMEAKFRDIEGYSSLVALSIMAMIDEEYNVNLKGDDIRKANTIEDLFNIVKSRV